MSAPQQDNRPALVLGGAGFIGSNLVDRLASEGNATIVFDSLARPGTERNLAWLTQRHGKLIRPVIADIRERAALRAALAASKVVFHLAAQVAVTTSLLTPRDDFEINTVATFSLLEMLREQKDPPPIIYASTNKVYGDLGDVPLTLTEQGYLPADESLRARGIDEGRSLAFHTPYGCSKGAADQYVLDYARSFGLQAAVLRMSCIYGPRQQGTEDQGWVAHFARQALAGGTVTLFGDGQQVRDILHVFDAVTAYLALWRAIETYRGRAFNLGGGPANAVTLKQVLGRIEAITNRAVSIRNAAWRAGDQRYFVADARAARDALDLQQPIGWQEGLSQLLEWIIGDSELSPSEVAA